MARASKGDRRGCETRTGVTGVAGLVASVVVLLPARLAFDSGSVKHRSGLLGEVPDVFAPKQGSEKGDAAKRSPRTRFQVA